MVDARPEAIFTLLSDRENPARRGPLRRSREPRGPARSAQRRKGPHRGPLCLRRSATTRVLPTQPPRWLNGTAEIGRRTRARVSWKLAGARRRYPGPPRRGRQAASPLERLLLTLGGRWVAAAPCGDS